MPAIDSPTLPEMRDASSRSLLLFRLEERLYALRLFEVGGVEGAGTIRRVPGADRGILGLVESGGRILTVFDLPRLLGEGAQSGPASFVRLAPPLAHCALYVPAAVRVGRAPLAEVAKVGSVTVHEHEGVVFHHVDPRRLLARFETHGAP